MSAFIITCPVCKKQYKLTPNDPASLAKQSFNCPSCKYAAPFTALIKDLPVPQPVTRTEEAPELARSLPARHAATKVAHAASAKPLGQRPLLQVAGSDVSFSLGQGTYILGRKSSDSPATLQLAPDIAMSRQHARLTVQPVAGKLVTQIVALKANNPLIVNGKIYGVSQPYTLKPGDRLQLGETVVIFSEATL